MRFKSNKEHAAERAERAAKAEIPSLSDDPAYAAARSTLTAARERLRQAEAARETFKETPEREQRRERAEALLATGELPAERENVPGVTHRDYLAIRESVAVAEHRFAVAKHDAEQKVINAHRKAWDREQAAILGAYLEVCRRADKLLEKARQWKIEGTKPPGILRFNFAPAARDQVFELCGSGRLADSDSFVRYVFRAARKAGLNVADLDDEFDTRGRAA